MTPQTSPRLDLAFVRRQFPALAHPETGQWAFFENAGGSYPVRHVVGRLHQFMVANNVQPYGPSDPSEAAGAAMDDSRARLAAALNVGTDELMFGPSTSMNTYVLAHALRAELGTGDEVIVSNQDHEANIGAWRRLAEGNSGIVVREWAVDPESGRLDVADLANLLNARTRLVFVTHCSNIAGEMHDVAAIARLVHDAGARLGVDGVSYAPHLLPDLAATGADFYFFSLYKVYGPHQGMLYVRREHLEGIANQGHFFNADYPDKRLTPAGPQHGEIACAGGIVDYLDAVYAHHFGHDTQADPRAQAAAATDLFHAHEIEQANRVLDLLRAKGARIVGPDRAEPYKRAPTIAFTSPRHSNAAIAEHLRARKVACGVGDFYARRLIEALGLDPRDGVVRLSLVHYNSSDDVDRLLEALDGVI
jgi:cysteine desulfurase family protein (TIGR01976 family)